MKDILTYQQYFCSVARQVGATWPRQGGAACREFTNNNEANKVSWLFTFTTCWQLKTTSIIKYCSLEEKQAQQEVK